MNLDSIIMVIILAMLPISELRGAIPYGIIKLGLDPLTVFLISVIFNFIPAPLLILFFNRIERIARKFNLTRKLIDKYFSRLRKASSKIEIYKEITLILFVAIPLPFTGVWSASIVAYLFGLNFRKSLLCIFIGVLIAGTIVLSITLLIHKKHLVYSCVISQLWMK